MLVVRTSSLSQAASRCAGTMSSAKRIDTIAKPCAVLVCLPVALVCLIFA